MMPFFCNKNMQWGFFCQKFFLNRTDNDLALIMFCLIGWSETAVFDIDEQHNQVGVSKFTFLWVSPYVNSNSWTLCKELEFQPKVCLIRTAGQTLLVHAWHMFTVIKTGFFLGLVLSTPKFNHWQPKNEKKNSILQKIALNFSVNYIHCMLYVLHNEKHDLRKIKVFQL